MEAGAVQAFYPRSFLIPFLGPRWPLNMSLVRTCQQLVALPIRIHNFRTVRTEFLLLCSFSLAELRLVVPTEHPAGDRCAKTNACTSACHQTERSCQSRPLHPPCVTFRGGQWNGQVASFRTRGLGRRCLSTSVARNTSRPEILDGIGAADFPCSYVVDFPLAGIPFRRKRMPTEVAPTIS